MSEGKDEKMGSKMPQNSAFQQQRLKAWQPLLTPKWVILTFLIVGAIFIPIGIAVLVASNNVVEVEYRYDKECSVLDTICPVKISITHDMDGPIYFYYKLTNFYQNHRRYVKSRSDTQLRGEDVLSNLASCDPLQQWNGSDLYPCGLIANSFFNDTFLAAIDNVPMIVGGTWREDGIAWASDKKEKFKPAPADSPAYDEIHRVGPGGFVLPNVTDEHLIVWMRTAGLPTFRKLYARLPDTSLKAGQVVSVNVSNNFPVASFSGEKSIVLSTTSWIGGKNNFLGVAYLVVGGTCLLLAFAFCVKNHVSPRPAGDMKYFNWKQPTNTHR